MSKEESSSDNIYSKEQIVPDVAFLGVCERAIHIRDGEAYTWRHHLIGLRNIVLSPIYPLQLSGFQLALAVYNPFSFEPAHIRILTHNDEEIMHMDITLMQADAPDKPVPRNDTITFIQGAYPVWAFLVFPISANNILVKQPGPCKVTLCRNGEEFTIGSLNFGVRYVAPLTEDRVQAIKSNPMAVKWTMAIIKCNKCDDEICAYVGLERSDSLEKDGYIWYKQLPEIFVCSCGSGNIDLHTIRENMHALLENVVVDEDYLSFTRMYEQEALEAICNQFSTLLDQNPPEEVVQRFIQENPLLLQQFSPARIFYKSPILTKYNTDIVILSQKKELWLVELEKPDIQLLKRDGGIASDLQHAFDQVRDWLYTSDDHRATVLACIGLKPEEVASIRGVVIAGRDYNYDENHLRKLKWTDFGKVSFFTFDDLLGSMVDLVRRISQL